MYQESETNKEHARLKSDAIDTMQKRIKFSSDRFNLEIFDFSTYFYEPMKIQILFSAFWIFNGFLFNGIILKE